MRKLVTTLSVAAAAFLATPASAAVVHFTGTTDGCFGASCTPSGGALDAGLLYTAGGFNQDTDANGFLGVGGTSDNLGAFSLGPMAHDYNGDVFKLLVTFTAPPGTLPGSTLFTTLLTGIVTSGSNGSVFIDFDNSLRNFTYTGGSFSFQVNDVSLTPGLGQIVSGQIRAVPEPATWGLMLLGFGGIGMAMRRRRTPVLAQVA